MFGSKKTTEKDKEKDKEKEALKKERKEKEDREKREKKEREKEKKGKKNKEEEKKLSVELPRSPREKDSLTFSPVHKELSFSGGTYQKEVHINERGKEANQEPNKEGKALGGTRSTPFFLSSHVTEADLKLSSSKNLARYIAEEYSEVKIDSPQWRAKVFKPELYRDLDSVFHFAKEFNVGIERPSICLLSKRGGSQGPLAFIESFLGTKLFSSPEVLLHRRPIHVIVENVRSCVEPKVSLKEGEGGLFQEVFFTKLGALLHNNENSASHNSHKHPHVILYQSRYVMNVEFYVASSYYLANNSEDGNEQLITYARPPSRTIIWFEPATEWDRFHGDALSTVKKVDPKLNRTVFVFTQFKDRVYKFTSAFEVNRFLSSPLTLPAANFFLTFVPSDQKVDGNLEEELYEAQQRDISSLQMLRYDARYANQIGAIQLKKYLLVDVVWKNYKKQIPRMIEDLQNYTEQSTENVSQLKHKKEILRDRVKLREMASAYLTSFLNDLNELVNGNCIGDPNANGSTLQEEKAYQDNGEWIDETGSPIIFESSQIPYANCKVFGSQQFERLICEFQLVAQKTKPSPVKTQEIAVSYSPRMNILWAAIDIAGKKLKESFIPLIKYLHKRAFHIFSRLVDIADHNNLLAIHLKKNSRAIDNQNSSRYTKSPSLTPFNPTDNRPQGKLDLLLDYNEWKNTQIYPFLNHKAREMYIEFLKNNKNASYQACMEEFYSTHTIYWDMVNFPTKPDLFQLASSDSQNPERAIHQLTAQIFDELKMRITTNVVINLYNFALNPIKLGYWQPITEGLSSWSDEYLDSLFEVDSHVKELDSEEHTEKEKIQSRHEASLLLKKINFSFSHMER
eukprot:TRINITY_DN3872_c0_g1_i1.p1 TRINITY_DN3872_c0_g1~~TRINITY_DN3872_c0_g1_i1.p1  ORF type:complete len:852 (-),score=275.34 TRINITY_DN3872_c0_g1_i1:101-2656(-)